MNAEQEIIKNKVGLPTPVPALRSAPVLVPGLVWLPRLSTVFAIEWDGQSGSADLPREAISYAVAGLPANRGVVISQTPHGWRVVHEVSIGSTIVDGPRARRIGD
jgi:hypothetical protein